MKEKTLFLLPIFLVLCVGVFFSYRWWKAKTQTLSSQTPVNESIELGDRGQSLLSKLGVKNTNSIELAPVEKTEGYGAVNWSEDKKTLTVVAGLPESKGALYQVWMVQDKKLVRLGTLTREKAGYVLNATFKNPLSGTVQIIVSSEQKNDLSLEKSLLEGTIEF